MIDLGTPEGTWYVLDASRTLAEIIRRDIARWEALPGYDESQWLQDWVAYLRHELFIADNRVTTIEQIGAP